MKNISFIIIIFSLALLCCTSCSKMEDSYEEFVVPGGIVYPGIAVQPTAYPGKNRVKVSWLKNVDPSVTHAQIFWNNYQDSLHVPMPTGTDSISVIIDNLLENTYTFFIRNYDSEGNISVPVEAFGVAYGENYASSLRNRPIIKNVMDANGQVFINWGEPDLSKGFIATEVKFTDMDGQESILSFDETEENSLLENYDASMPYQYRSLYTPDPLSIDTFATEYVDNPEAYFLLDKTTFSVTDFSTQHDSKAANRVTNVIDGNPGSRWHTHASNSSYPHFVTVDMGYEATISGFEIFRMTDDDRACDTFQLLVSADNETWEDLGEFNFNRLTNEGQFYEIASMPKANYFKFVALTGPEDYFVLGEINVYGKVEL